MSTKGKALNSQKEIDAVLAIPREKVICFDVETTGLNKGGNDEILQVSICDGNGKLVFNSLIKPSHRKRWPNAEKIHGISPKDVEIAPTLAQVKPKIEAALSNAQLLIGYNMDFDIRMLKAGGVNVPNKRMIDVMHEYSATFGQYNPKYNDWTWVKLTTAAAHYGIRFGAHNAAYDAQATAQVFYKLLGDEAYLTQGAVVKRRGSSIESFDFKSLSTIGKVAFVLGILIAFSGLVRLFSGGPWLFNVILGAAIAFVGTSLKKK